MMPGRGGLSTRPITPLILSLYLIFMIGWANGDCSGRSVLNGHQGHISDGPQNYTPSSHCEWLIDAGGPNKSIHLVFDMMGTECSFDFLFVYDGNSYDSPRIAAFSGDSLPLPVTAYSGHMLLYLFSDRNHVLSGFEARYQIFDCPWNCSGHGECRDHKCHCNASYSGTGCEVKHCPDNCGLHGKCGIHPEQHKCDCNPGYTGQGCDLQVAGAGGQGHWYTVRDEADSTGFPKRTAHTAVYTHDCIWVFGGFDLNTVKDDLLRFCLKENAWFELEKPFPTHSSVPASQTIDPFSNMFAESTTPGWSNVDNTSMRWEEDRYSENIGFNVKEESTASSKTQVRKSEKWPAARSGHAMDKFRDGFFIFGGRLSDGSLSNELWFFNISSEKWLLCAEQSKVKPLKMHGQTLTAVEDRLYTVGGTNENHSFVDKIYSISATIPDQWEMVQIWGGMYTPPQLVGHSTVYHPHSGSLFIFGGYIQNSGLFSDRSNDIYTFHLESRYWSRLHVRDSSMPSHPWQRAFHSGVLMGQYLVVYGGKTHTHVHLEVCYNNEIFFYHLGCHIWLNHTYFTSNITMPKKGRFGHTAVVANGNIMFIIGGYSGQVLGDVIAYKVPDAIADYECTPDSKHCPLDASPPGDEDHCESYAHKLRACQDDPECVFCKRGRTDRGPKTGSCLHRSRVELCIDQDYHDSSDRCPGICPALHTCGACVSHGQTIKTSSVSNHESTSKKSSDVDLTTDSISNINGDDINITEPLVKEEWISNADVLVGKVSPRRSKWRTYNRDCAWCVKEAQCQTASAPSGTCQSPEQTSSGMEGWWGGLSSSLRTLHQCQTEDFPAGLHWLKYRDGFNNTFPDEVSIIREPAATLGYTKTKMIESAFTYKSKFIGFMHPLGAKAPPEKNLTLFMSISTAAAQLFLSTDATEEHKERVIGMHYTLDYKTDVASRRSGQSVFPNITRGNKYFLEQVTQQKNENGTKQKVIETLVRLEWNGAIPVVNDDMKMKHQVISSEFLEPFRKGNCSGNYNCLSCLSDTLCGWCELKRACVLRNVSAHFCQNTDAGEGQYLITSPEECPHCQRYFQCSTCAQDILCEWQQENGHCNRRYRHRDTSEVIRDEKMCFPPCHKRPNCSECVDRKGECVWCHNTRSCLPFSDYVTHYVYGQCTSWKDSSSRHPKCRTCEEHSDCGSCLSQFGCGWCGLALNPGIGLCVDGDFAGTSGNRSCSRLLRQKYDLNILNMYGPASSVSVMDAQTSTSVYNREESTASQQLPASVWAYDQCPDIEECLLGLHDCHPNATCINSFGAFECHCNQGYTGDGRRFCNLTCFHKCLHGWCSGPPHYQCKCELGWTGSSCDQDCGCNFHSSCELAGPGTCDECQHWTDGSSCSKCQSGAWGNATSPEGCQECKCNGHSDSSRGHCNVTNGNCFCKDNTEGIHCERCSHGFFGNPRHNGLCYQRCDARTFLASSYYGATGDEIQRVESRLSRQVIQKRGMFLTEGMRGNTLQCLWIISTAPDVRLAPDRGESLVTYTINVTGDVQCETNAVYVYDGIPKFISANESGKSRELGAFCGKDEKQSMTVYATSGVFTIFFEGDLSGAEFKCTYRAQAYEIDRGQNQVCEKGICMCRSGFFGPTCLTPICPNNCSADRGHGHCQNGLCICNLGFTGAGCSDAVQPDLPDIQLLADSALAQSPLSQPFSLPRSPSLSLPLGKGQGPSPRAGHTLTSCGGDLAFLYGGYSPQEGVHDDLWVFNISDSSWTRVVPSEKYPSPGGRYYHSAACIPLEKIIYVFGGFAPLKEGRGAWPSKTMWKFNILQNTWKEAIAAPGWMPALAGHSLTHAGSTLLVVMGGFSAERSFNDMVYEYNTSKGHLAWTEIKHQRMSGAWPRGLYGHSAVYDEFTNTVYLFGGHRYDKRFMLSDVLYQYEVRQKSWSVLDSKAFITYDNDDNIEPRAFHTSVHLRDFMVIIGGKSNGKLGEDLLLYRFGCDDYFRIKLKDTQLSQAVVSLGLAAVAKDDSIYIFGGFAGSASGKLLRLRLPADACTSVKDREECEKFDGCHYTSAPRAGFNNTAQLRCRSVPGYKRCDDSDIKRVCNHFSSCDACVTSSKAKCVWCSDCGVGSCVPHNEGCRAHIPNCRFSMENVNQCQQCKRKVECAIANFSKRTRTFSKRSTEQERQAQRVQFVREDSCHLFTSCKSCLSLNEDNEEYKVVCAWSEMLQECMPKNYIPLRCSMGECHYLRKWPQTCPVSCLQYRKCGDCVAVTGCGWCSKQGANGEGFCMEGGITGPTGGATCKAGNITVLVPDPELLNYGGEKKKQDWKPKWAYDVCPPENECKNNHHTCDKKTQICIDYESGYACECKTGYVKNGNVGPCEPVCHQGCQNGQCVEPDSCRCNFGYVGRNCSTACDCNMHSNCLDENNISKCIKCENNTQGDRCQECKPLFVGDPKKGGKCTPCRKFCNNHTDLCMTVDDTFRDNEKHIFGHDPAYEMSHAPQRRGPKEDEAVCSKCEHNTTGNQCGQCTNGHFRKEGKDNLDAPCQPCHCNGHGDVCNSKTGENCRCHNNTESPSCNPDEAECWQLQCIKCEEYFQGTPTNGHQCYRQMTSDRDYCFDPTTQNNCNQSPDPLLKGRTVFFVVQPRYLNVDIRVTIDVIAGKTDIYLSNHEDTFQVFVDKKTGMHDVYLDKAYVSAQAGMSRRSADDPARDDGDGIPNSQHEAGAARSVRITDSVPDYLRLKTTDADYYKLSQFESMDAVDDEDENQKEEERQEEVDKVSRERRRPWQKQAHRRGKTRHGMRLNKRKNWRRNKLFERIKKSFPDKTSKEYKNMMFLLHSIESDPDDLGHERSKRMAQHTSDLRREAGEAHVLDFDSFYSLSEYESLMKPLSYNSSQTDEEKRQPSRRAITVTDTRKGLRQHNFKKFRNKGLKRAGGSTRSVLASSKRDGSDRNGRGRPIKMGEIEAGRLNTYITVGQHNSVLVVRNVQFRLVITLPRDQHNLGSSHFFIILRSVQGEPNGVQSSERSIDAGFAVNENPTRGTLYFRQDQPHIDLFVFFSVFFSCFFLFLAVCVLLWKMKQTLDVRRTRQLQEREMECMASRPFAHILVLVEPPSDSVSSGDHGGGGGDILPNSFLTGSFGGLNRQRSKLGRYHQGGGLRGGNNQHQHLEQYMTSNPNSNIILSTGGGGDISAIVTSNSIVALNSFSAPVPVPHHRPSGQRELGVVPIAIEPTEDGMAGVGTVVFQLPGGAAAPSHLCLGSALTTRISMPPSSHHHHHKSASVRRRTSTTYC